VLSCYGDHSLPYCYQCLSLLNCADDKACQMNAGKQVCNALSSAGQPSNKACTMLAKLPG